VFAGTLRNMTSVEAQAYTGSVTLSGVRALGNVVTLAGAGDISSFYSQFIDFAKSPVTNFRENKMNEIQSLSLS
jgi:hypothetical protein